MPILHWAHTHTHTKSGRLFQTGWNQYTQLNYVINAVSVCPNFKSGKFHHWFFSVLLSNFLWEVYHVSNTLYTFIHKFHNHDIEIFGSFQELSDCNHFFFVVVVVNISVPFSLRLFICLYICELFLYLCVYFILLLLSYAEFFVPYTNEFIWQK